MSKHFKIFTLLLIMCIYGVCLGSDMNGRKVNISSLCLLEGEEYENISYVIKSLEQVEQSSNLQIVVTPFMPFLQFSEANQQGDLKPFCDWAKRRYAVLVVAMKEKSKSGKVYYSSVVIGRDGKISGKYRKTHRTSVDSDEFALADELDVLEVEGVRLGLSLTSDFYFMEIYNVYWMKGADVFIWQHYPEMMRDHSTWRYLLQNRAFDYGRHLVTAMYADDVPYLTSNRILSMKGSPWARSMVISPEGVVIADTGYYDGIANQTVDLDRRKSSFDKGGSLGVFTVANNGDRKAFAPIAKEWEKPELPKYKKRKARIVVTARVTGKNWRDDAYPESVLNLLKKSESLKPDMILFSEEMTKIKNPTTKKAMEDISDWAKKNKCYVVIGGLRDQDHWSIARVWDRKGEIIFTQPIYWTKGIDEIKVFDTDFARIGVKTCGDLFIPEIDRVLALKGAEIIFDPSLMWGPDGYYNEISARTRSIDNGVYTVCSHFHHSDFNLRSFICDPYGVVLASTTHGEEELTYVDIDFSKEKVYYTNESTEVEFVEEKNYGHYAGEVPDQKRGWRDMLFENRRPELYDIIPTENEITLKRFK